MTVLCAALDSCSHELLRQMLADGQVPNIARVLSNGRWSTVRPPEVGSAAAWPAFITGRSGDEMRLFGEWVWDPRSMSIVRLPEVFEEQFFHRLHDDGVSVGVLDYPFAPEVDWERGFLVGEWGVHHRITGRLWMSPHGAEEVVASVPPHPYFGVNLRPDHPGDIAKLHATARGGIEGVRTRGELVRRLAERFPCDLLMLSFQEIHHSGHYLWHATEPDHPLFSDIDPRARSLGDPVRSTLTAIDRELGILIEELRPSSVMLFALNGMEPYRGTPDVLGRILRDRGFANETKSSLRGAVVAALRRHAPGWMRELYHRSTSREAQLEGLRSSLLPPLSWDETRAFQLPPEEWSPIEVNLRGREARGEVSLGPEYERLVDELVALVSGLSNVDGRSAIRKVIRADDPTSGGPDILVHWEHSATYPPASLAGAPDYEMLYSHHTGHHLPVGFCIAQGEIAADLEDEMLCEDLHRPIVKALGSAGAH